MLNEYEMHMQKGDAESAKQFVGNQIYQTIHTRMFNSDPAQQ
jgi:hypothetical protein